MKFSDISNLKLSPGTYVITASFDGDDQYNPVEIQYILVITGNEGGQSGGQGGGQSGGGGSTDPRPTEDEDDNIVATDPTISFSPSTVSIVEANLEEYPLRWTQYLKNTSRVSYTVEMSEGLIIEGADTVGWDESGTYTIRLTTVKSKRYNSKTITLTLNVTSKVNPQIEYVNDNNQFTLEDGVLVKRYYNLEKREGVYMFDLLQPTNPYNLPLTYMVDETNDASINVPSNKVYLSKEGKYMISAIFAGDKTYRASMTSYMIKFYEGEEPDEPEDYKTRQLPNLSFSTSQVAYLKREDNKYEGIEVNNPFNVRGVWSVSKGSITADGKIITFDDLGNVIVSYGFLGDDKYNKQTASYILNVYQDDNPNNLPMPNIGFRHERVEVDENDKHEYNLKDIQVAYNYSGVNINYYYKNKKIDDLILKTTDVGELTITAMSDENEAFARHTISYILFIKESVKQDPEISFDDAEVTESKASNNQYLVQFARNPHDLDLKYESTNGYVEDGILHYDGIGRVVITAKFEGNFYYNADSISYVLIIENSNKKSPELSFNDSEVFMNSNDSNVYSIQQVNNPYNVALRWYVDKGELDSEVSPQSVTAVDTDTVNVYCKSVEDDTYKSEVVSYKLYIGIDKKYLDFEVHDDYDLYDDPGTFNLELLRYKKRQDLAFVSSYWDITSSLADCTVDDKYYEEEGDYIVVMARLTFKKTCSPLISIKYIGNAEFYTSSIMKVYVRLHSKNKKSPEISFPSDYVVMNKSDNDKYVLQDVDNPHEVEIIYSSSGGSVEGNILTYYSDTPNVVITATSVETEVYESQSISYVMKVEECDKPSIGIHFPIEKIEVSQTQDGVYEIQDVVDAEGNIIPKEELDNWGSYSSSSLGELQYDESRQKWTITRPNWYGTIYVKFNIRETIQYRSEVVSYTLVILNGRKPLPNIEFKDYWIKVNPNSEGKYEVQELINPNNVPIDRWFIETTDTDAYLDDEHNPHYIYTPNKTYITVKVVSQETEEYSSQTQSYSMSINSGGNDDPELSFDFYDLYELWNEEGIYTFQKANNPHNVSPLVYNTEVGEIVNNDHILCKNLKKNAEFWVSVKFDGDVQYKSAFLRYWIHVSSKAVKRYKYDMCENVEIIGELNKDFEVDIFKYSTDYDDYEFSAKDWTITCGTQHLTCKELKSREVNGYIVVSGVFVGTWEYTTPVTVTYRGQYEDFVFEVTKERTMYITFSVEHVVDPRIRPKISFSDYTYDVIKSDDNTYKLQKLNKPDDVEIDYWEVDKGGFGWETARIIDDEYVYYEGTDYIHISVHTKEDDDNYLATTDGYSMYVNEASTWYAQLSFKLDISGAYKNDEGVYNLQALQNPHKLSPIIWASDKGTISEDGKTLTYDGVGQVKITARFEGNDDYEEGEASYIFIIKDEYEKKDIDLTHCGIPEVIFDDFGQECEVTLGKYSISSGLTFSSDEWTFKVEDSYSSMVNLVKLYSVDEGNYRYIKATLTFSDSNRSVSYILKFLGNDKYNANRTDSLLRFEKTHVEKIDPEVTLDENTPDRYQRLDAEPRKYLIRRPTSRYDDVEFELSTPTQGATIEKEGDDWYAYYDGTSDIVINIRVKDNPKYYSRLLTYSIDIYVYVDPRTYAPIMFGSNTYTIARRTDGIYANVCDFRNFKNLDVTLTSDKGTFDQDTMTLEYDGDGYVTITAVYEGDETTYFYTEKTCTVLIQDTYEKVKLNAVAYDSFHVEVEGTYNTEHDVCLLKWPKNELFEFNDDEWTLSMTSASCSIHNLYTYTEPEGDYTVLKGKITYDSDGSTVCTLYLKDNTYFYDGRWGVTVYFTYKAPSKIDPLISWPNPEPDKVIKADKYLIQTPQSEYDDVEFDAPESATPNATVVKEGDDYYVYYSGTSNILIKVRNSASDKYYTRIISYYIRTYVPTVLPEAPFNFGSTYYSKNRRTDGIYQPADLRVYDNNLTLRWTSDLGTIDPDTGVLTYDGDGDVTITVIFDGDETYRYTEKSYTLHIVNVYEKTKLNAIAYDKFHIEVEGEYSTEYSVSLLKWPTNELFAFNDDEWTLSNQSVSCNIYGLYTEPEGDDYTVLKGKITFTSDSSTTITINFRNNEFFYNDRFNVTVYYKYKEGVVPDPDEPGPEPGDEKADPLITYQEVQKHKRDDGDGEHIYLIEMPDSPYAEVEFDAPTTCTYGATIIQVGKGYFVQYDGTGEVFITWSTIETEHFKSDTAYISLYIYSGHEEIHDGDDPEEEDIREEAPIYFLNDEVTRSWNGGVYKLQIPINDENLELEWGSDYGTIHKLSNTISFDDNDHEVTTIWAEFYGNSKYYYKKIEYKLIVPKKITREYLGNSPYDYNTNLTVIFNKQYYVNLLRLDKSQYTNTFEYNPEEWSVTVDDERCECINLLVHEEDQYVYIVGEFVFYNSGNCNWTLNFTGNTYFYQRYWGGSLCYVRDTSLDLKDPEIYWSGDNPEVVPYDRSGWYLLQTPKSPYPEVEFEDIRCSKGGINGNYLIIEEDDVEVEISVTSKASDVYMSKTISYILKIGKAPIEKTSPNISFDEAIVEHDVIWSSNKPKRYKVQPIHNPYGVSIRFECSKGTLRQIENITVDGDLYDYGYYLEYDEYSSQNEYEDILITAISQENEYYISERPEYTIRITNPERERVLLSFSQNYVGHSKNNAGLYEIQDVIITINKIHPNDDSDMQGILDNLTYYTDKGTIETINGKRYLRTSGTGRFTIYAGFGGNEDYRPAEESYVILIEEVTLEEWPFFFEHRDIYTPVTDSLYYPIQDIISNNGSTMSNELRAMLTWNLPEGWTKTDMGQLKAPDIVTEDTEVLVECTIPEFGGYAEKTIRYTLHIETDHRTRLDVRVNNNTVFRVATLPTEKKIELLRWPVIQGYQYYQYGWTFSDPKHNISNTGAIRHLITVEQESSWYVMYITTRFTSYDTTPIELTFTGTSDYYGPETWGLEIEIRDPQLSPEPEKTDPDIYFEEIGIVNYKESASGTYYKPIVIDNSHQVVYHMSWQQIKLKSSIDTTRYYDATDINNYDRIGSTTTNLDNTSWINFQGYGYLVVDLWTEATEIYNSISLYKIVKITMNPSLHREMPTIYFKGQQSGEDSIRIVRDKTNDNRYQLPEIVNQDNVPYTIYRYKNANNLTEISVDENRYFTYTGSENTFTIAIITEETSQYYSKTIFVYYTLIDQSDSRFTSLQVIGPPDTYGWLTGDFGSIVTRKINNGDTLDSDNYWQVFDEVNYTRTYENGDHSYSKIENVYKFIEWNKDDYTFDINDWEIEMDLTQSNSLFTQSYFNKSLIYSEVQSITVGDKSYLIPHIGFGRIDPIDIKTNQYRYFVYLTCTISFKGAKDGNGQYIHGLEPQNFNYELKYEYPNYSSSRLKTLLDNHKIYAIYYQRKNADNFKQSDLPLYKSAMYQTAIWNITPEDLKNWKGYLFNDIN